MHPEIQEFSVRVFKMVFVLRMLLQFQGKFCLDDPFFRALSRARTQGRLQKVLNKTTRFVSLRSSNTAAGISKHVPQASFLATVR